MSDFDSLVTALDGWFEKPLCELSDELRQRVMDDFFPLLHWDKMTPDQRRSVANQCDNQNDPDMEAARTFCWNLFADKKTIEREIEEWKAIATPTATDLAHRNVNLGDLQEKLDHIERQEQQARRDYPVRPDHSAKPRGHLNHDTDLQARANEIAAEHRATTGRSITRDKVGRILAKELSMDEATVTRRIRKQWK